MEGKHRHKGVPMKSGEKTCHAQYFNEPLRRAKIAKRDETETLPAGESLETTVEWKGLCGTIGKGEHRIILIVDEQPIACEFEKD